MAGDSPNFNLRVAPRRQSVVRRQFTYKHSSKPAALISIWLVLMRGNSVKMANVAGEFIVTEQVLS